MFYKCRLLMNSHVITVGNVNAHQTSNCGHQRSSQVTKLVIHLATRQKSFQLNYNDLEQSHKVTREHCYLTLLMRHPLCSARDKLTEFYWFKFSDKNFRRFVILLARWKHLHEQFIGPITVYNVLMRFILVGSQLSVKGS